MERYLRHIALSEVGHEGQEKLLKAKVLVIGAGGLGCPILQYLTAAGVGVLGIMDDDVVEESNLQRQILYGNSSLGRHKAVVAKERLEDLNPSIVIHAICERLRVKNAISLFEQYDIIVDGTDNFESRYLINDAALITDKPVVFGAIYKFEGQVSVFNYQNGPSYRCLFPKAPSSSEGMNCVETGVLGVLPGIIGSFQANEVLKMILGIKAVLSGKLLCYDAKTGSTHQIKITKNDLLINEIKNRPLKQETAILCHSNIQELTAEKALRKANAIFLDVREWDEKPKIELDHYQQIPLSILSENLHKINTDAEIIVFCKSGQRSKKAINILTQNKLRICYNLKGGTSALLGELNHKLI